MSNLEKLFHPFVPQDKRHWAGYVSPRMGFFTNDIPGSQFATGFLVANKIGTMDIPHIHDGAYNFFVFTGADLDNIFDAEFEVDFFIGDSASSMEAYSITKPAYVCAPPGVWHSPVYFKKVVKGINSMVIYGGHSSARIFNRLDADGNDEAYLVQEVYNQPCVEDASKICNFCGKCYTDPNQTERDVLDYVAQYYKNQSTAGKYRDCIFELKKDYHKLGDAVMNPRAVFKGVDDMAQAQHQFSVNIITKPVKLGDDEPVSNGQVAEFLWFSGTDVTRSFECFDAEIEVMLGDDPDNMQMLTFDKPGVVAVPPGMWRGAINVKRAGKPVCFMPWYPHDKKRYKLTQKSVNGETMLVYDDETTIKNPTVGDELFLQIKR